MHCRLIRSLLKTKTSKKKQKHDEVHFKLWIAKCTLTVPSVVTAANTVEEYGDQATSPTAAFRSKVNIGVLEKHTYSQGQTGNLHFSLYCIKRYVPLR